MALTWPGTLPQRLLIDTIEQSAPDGTIRSATDRGPAMIRRRTSLAPYPLSGEMVMTLTQWATLRTFRESSGGDVQVITFPDPDASTGTIEVRFTVAPVSSRISGTHVRVAMQFEVIP